MPHCIIEYSRPLEAIVSPEALMESVHQGAVSSGLFDASAIKVRALPYDHYRVGTEQGVLRLEARTILRPEMVVTVKLWSAAVYRVLRGGR